MTMTFHNLSCTFSIVTMATTCSFGSVQRVGTNSPNGGLVGLHKWYLKSSGYMCHVEIVSSYEPYVSLCRTWDDTLGPISNVDSFRLMAFFLYIICMQHGTVFLSVAPFFWFSRAWILFTQFLEIHESDRSNCYACHCARLVVSTQGRGDLLLQKSAHTKVYANSSVGTALKNGSKSSWVVRHLYRSLFHI